MWKSTRLMLVLPLTAMSLLAAASPALALNINLTFNTSGSSSVTDFGANTNSFTSAVAYAAQTLDNDITDPITVNITVYGATGTSTFGASNYTYYGPYTYTNVYNALSTNATQPAQQIALANLPVTDPSPGGPNTYNIPSAEAKALGLISGSNTASDGLVTFGAGYNWAFDPNNQAVSGKYSFLGIAYHELSEAMGRVWGLGNGSDGQGYYVPYDLFRFDGGTTTRDMTNNTNVWFSINGGFTDLNSFNYAFKNSSGTDTEDPTDWGIGVANANYQNSLTNDAFNAYSAGSVVNALSSVDLTVLNVMGYHLSAAAMSGGTWAHNGGGSWTNASFWTYPVVPTGGTASVYFAGVPANPSSPITVTLDGNQSVGSLFFNVTNNNGYSLAQGTGGTLSLGTPGGGSITVLAGSHAIFAPMRLEGPLTVYVVPGDALQLSGPIGEAAAGTSVTLNGPGTVNYSAAGSFTGDTNVNRGTLQVSGGLLPAASENISGSGSTPVVVLSSGVNLVSYGLNVGYDPGTSGAYTLQGGSLSAQTEYIGYSGSGSFMQSGGTNSSSFLGTGGVAGTYNLNSGLIFTQEIEVGGTFTQTGGTVHAGDGSMVGMYFAGSGNYYLNHGLLLVNAENIYDNGSGSFVQQGGTHTVINGLYLESSSLADGIYNLQGGSLSVDSEYLGNLSIYGTAGAFVQSGGTHSVSSHLYLGYGSGAVGTYTLSGNGLLSAPNEDVGYSAKGSFAQSGGTHSVANILTLGSNAGGNGSYNLSGGSLYADGENIGVSGSGSFIQSGGTNMSPAVLNVGDGGVASYSLSGGLVSTQELGIGGPKNGVFTQSGGSVFAGGGAVIALLLTGTTGNPSATYNLQAGLLSVTGQDYIGDLGIGSFVQSGGTHSVSGGTLLLGSSILAGVGTGTYNLGGTGYLSVPTEYVAYYGTGSFIQSGGMHSVSAALYLGYNTGARGSYSLVGAGQLNTSFYEYVGYQGTGSFTQSAGVNSMQVLYLADFANSSGTYSLSNAGVINNSNGEYIGYAGTGSFTQSGGINNAYYLTLGAALTATGSYSLSDGLLNGGPGEDVGYVGNGTFLQSGGTNEAGQLALAPFGGAGSYSLSTGLLDLSGLSRGAGATSFTIGAGTVQAGASFATSVPIALNRSGSTAVFNTSGNSLTLSGALTGPGGLQKTGAGTLVLAASNNYTGPTALTAGTLEADNGNSGSATGSNTVTLNGGVLAAGAAGGTILGPVVAGSGPHTIAPGALLASSYGTLSLDDGLTTNLYTTLSFSVSSALGMNGGNGQPIYYGDLINLDTSSLIVGAGTDITFKVNPTATGDYRLFADFNNSPNLNNFLLPSQNGVVYALSTTVDPGHIDLLVAAGNAGASGGTWGSPNSGNWTTAADWSCNPLIPTSGTVYFPGAPVVPITVSLNGNQSAAALVFNVSNANGYTLSQGSGGALTLGDSTGATITVSSGPQVISAPLRLGGNLAVNVAAGASLQLAGVVSQGASGLGLTLNGPGLLTFGGTGNYSGDTTVNSGTLQINAGAQLPAANEYVGANAAAAYVVQNGGNNTITAGGALQGLIVGYGNGNAYYNLNGGLLNSANEFISYSGYSVFTQTGGTNQAGFLSVGTYYNGNYYLSGGLVSANVEYINSSALNGAFTQSGGTNQIATNLTVGFLGGGSYTMSAGLLSADNAYVGYGRGGNVFQSGGNFSLSTALYLAYQNGTQGNYYLSNSGLLTAPNEYIGYAGNGTFNQSGGTNSVPAGNLYLGYYPGGSGTYNLSGGVLDPVTEYVGNGGVGIFYQTGGTNTAANVNVNGGYFLLSGGQLQGSGSGTIGVVNGGFQSPGTLDLSQFAAVSAGTGALLDLSGNMLNTAAASVSVGPDSLLIVPQGFDPITSYASYSNQGLIHTLGSTLSVSAGIGFGGWGTIADPVACQGTILATAGGWINLNNGLSLADPGQVNLGTGTVIVNDTNFSGMTGGSLTAALMVVGSNGTGSFPQSGGASTLSSLYLGYNAADSGTYLLSGTGQLSVGSEYVGYAGSGAFTQTGGTHAVGTLYLAEQYGSAGTYDLNGGLLSLSALYQGSGAAAFNFSGGTFQAASSSLYIYMPFTLNVAGSNGVFDTNGQSLTLAGPISGPGGLIVAGSGTLTLAVSNNYTGTTLVSNGTLVLGDSNALSGSTFDTSGTGAVVFNGGVGGFAFGGLQGSGSLLLTDASFTDVALTVGLNNADTTFSGSLSDSSSGGSLTKAGTGTLTLTGTNTYGGGTFVEGGTLVVTNNEGLLDGSNVAVGDPALLTMFGGVVPADRSTGFSGNAVPEPSAFALLAGGGLVFLALRCRRP